MITRTLLRPKLPYQTPRGSGDFRKKNSRGTHVFEIPKAYRPAKLQEIGIPQIFAWWFLFLVPKKNRVSESSYQWCKSGVLEWGWSYLLTKGTNKIIDSKWDNVSSLKGVIFFGIECGGVFGTGAKNNWRKVGLVNHCVVTPDIYPPWKPPWKCAFPKGKQSCNHNIWAATGLTLLGQFLFFFWKRCSHCYTQLH